uniref:RNase H type-1 domain-containing protein n=1 Tax=Nicotiana tabacum TaxID=4097 RepID=A0A1S3ZEI9_TOBAC|nr:PREDICTED: uncharacterized protein LOC107785972 [Nicotiana tabacum]
MQHTFVNGEMARNTWKFFGAPLGIRWDDSPILNIISRWWSSKAKNKVVQVLSHLKWVISKHNRPIVDSISWSGLCETLLNLSPKFHCFPVIWERPNFGWIKLNTDGSKLRDGLIGAGGVVRNHRGEMLMAFAQALGNDTSNKAEARAALIGLLWCQSNGYDKIIPKCDSKLVVDMLDNKFNPPWQIENTIREAQSIIFQHNVVSFRKANYVADVPSKWSHELQEKMVFQSMNLPRNTIGYYRLDKIQLPNLRHKIIKNQYVRTRMLLSFGN